jgi:hypothetical protein
MSPEESAEHKLALDCGKHEELDAHGLSFE